MLLSFPSKPGQEQVGVRRGIVRRDRGGGFLH